MPAPFALGLMLPSTQGGTIIADVTPRLAEPTWALNRTVTLMAERANFDFVLSQVKWRGYGGPSGHWDAALESFSLMAALAAVTDRIRLYASIAIRTVHPAVLAKMAATIDEVSGGRFGVNIVAGWNKFEYSQMGLWAQDDYYKYRYEYAAEYLEVLRRLWAPGRASFAGRFFQVEDCVSAPKPRQALPIVCAGQSEGALQFVARSADFSFVGRQDDSPAALGGLCARLSGLAAEHGREVGSYVLLTIIAEDTDEAAAARRDEYLDHADPVAIGEWMRASGMDLNRVSYESLAPIQRTFMAIPVVVGSYATVARHLDALAENGVSGACMVFPDFEPDLARFIAHVLPLVSSTAASTSRPASWSPVSSSPVASTSP